MNDTTAIGPAGQVEDVHPDQPARGQGPHERGVWTQRGQPQVGVARDQ